MIDLKALTKNPALETARLVAVDVHDLENVMANHVGLFAYAVALFEEAKTTETAAKQDLDFMKSSEYRDLFNAEQMTLGKAEKVVGGLSTVRTYTRKWLAAHKMTGTLRALVQALDHRRDMIVQIAARQRQEIAADTQR